MVSLLLWQPSIVPRLFITGLPSSPSSSPSSCWVRISISASSQLDRRPLFRTGQPLLPTSFTFLEKSRRNLPDFDPDYDGDDADDDDDDYDVGGGGNVGNERKDRDLAPGRGRSCAPLAAIATAVFNHSEEIPWVHHPSISVNPRKLDGFAHDANVLVGDEKNRDLAQGILGSSSGAIAATEFSEPLERQRSSQESSRREKASSSSINSLENHLLSSRKTFNRSPLNRASGVLPSHEKDALSNDNIDFPEKHPLSSRKSFNRYDFARTFDVLALRVPSDEWRDISYGIEGHLLNWKGVDNMVRVDGDDLDVEIKSLLNDEKGIKASDVEDSFLRAVYRTTAPPSHLEKQQRAVEKMRSHVCGNLEQISRPKQRILKQFQKKRENSPKMLTRKNKPYMVEEIVPIVCAGESHQKNISVHTKRWIGPSRLLLLDIKYTRKCIQDLPMVVQVLLNERKGCSKSRQKRELVSCKLTLFYEYWSMEEILRELLPEGKIVMPAIKVVGHMAQLDLDEHYAHLKHIIGKVLNLAGYFRQI